MAGMKTYDKGDKARVTATFTVTATGAAIDPTAVVAKVKTPAGVTATYTYGVDNALVRTGTGVFYVEVDLTAAGTWSVAFLSTGDGQAAADQPLYVKTPRIS